MVEPVILRAGILHDAQAPAIHIGAIQQHAWRTFHRRGGADDLAEISSAGVRLMSKRGSRVPFDIRLPRDVIGNVRVQRGWIKHYVWLEADGERHGLAFKRRADLDLAVAAIRDVLGIVPVDRSPA